MCSCSGKVSYAVTRAWSKVPVWMQNPGGSTASWHVGLVALDALPCFLMSEWVVCLVCRAGENMANGETSHSERHWVVTCLQHLLSPLLCSIVLLTAPVLKLSPGHMDFAVIHLSVLCDPEISDGHQNRRWGESFLSVLTNPSDSQINIKNPRSGVFLWVISACEQVAIVVLV